MDDLLDARPKTCGIHRPTNDLEPYILCCVQSACEKYSFDGRPQPAGKLINNRSFMTPRIVSLGGKTYAVGSDNGKKVEEWNGSSWVMAPKDFQVKAERFAAGVMAVPRDFVC